MTEHEFTLVIDGDLTDEDVARELFEASEAGVDSLPRFLTVATGGASGAGQTWLSGLVHWTQRSGKPHTS